VKIDLSEAFLQAFGRHFVTLSCMYTPPNSTAEIATLFSGFVIAIEDVWFYVTAGHVPRAIQSGMEAGGKFDVWRLGDQAARGPFNHGIPFDFDFNQWIVLDEAEVGLDYAALPLRNLFREGLERGNVIPLTKNGWGDHVTEHDQWVLVGVPSESVTHNGESLLTARVVGVALTKADAPEGAGAKAENQFYARLTDASDKVVKNVEGMSGGPIFATKKDDKEIRYTVIGVQSAWYRNDRIIAACPFSSLAIGLENAVRMARAELANAPP
jgi:hypothetical protein